MKRITLWTMRTSMSNPVDTFLTASQERNAKKREATQNMWHTWNDSGRQPEHLEPLINTFQGLIGARVKEWKPPSLPKSAFEAELTKHVIKAIEGYDPNRGASLNTHVTVRIQKAKRYMVQQQNFARIPEGQTYRIGDINRARDELEEDLGRVPTHIEIGAHLGMPAKLVGTIVRAQRRDIASSAWESDPDTTVTFRELEILPLMRDTLTDDKQKAVFDHIYGYGGAAKITSTGQLAGRLGLSSSQVSRIKTRLGASFKSYL